MPRKKRYKSPDEVAENYVNGVRANAQKYVANAEKYGAPRFRDWIEALYGHIAGTIAAAGGAEVWVRMPYLERVRLANEGTSLLGAGWSAVRVRERLEQFTKLPPAVITRAGELKELGRAIAAALPGV